MDVFVWDTVVIVMSRSIRLTVTGKRTMGLSVNKPRQIIVMLTDRLGGLTPEFGDGFSGFTVQCPGLL